MESLTKSCEKIKKLWVNSRSHSDQPNCPYFQAIYWFLFICLYFITSLLTPTLARSRIDAIFSNVENVSLRRGLRGYRAESPPPTVESLSVVEGIDSGGGISGGAGNTSTFRRKRPQRQGQSQQRTAGINLMRGSMFQLNTTSTSAATGAATSMDMDMRYGYDSKQTPMTPGPGRRAPVGLLLPLCTVCVWSGFIHLRW